MRKLPLLTVFVLLMPILPPILAQPAPDTTALTDSTLAKAYQVYRPDGQVSALDDILAAVDTVDVLFIGEQHDDPVAHYLQAELLRRTYQRLADGASKRPVTLSMEMFERDVQPILDEYLAGFITESHFLRSSRPWQNYKTDYKPMVEFARENGLHVLAANAPRRYVNRVSRLGPASLDSLPDWAQTWLPPLPYPGPSAAYQAKWNRLMSDMMRPPPDEEPAASSDSAVVHTLPTTDSLVVHSPKASDSTAPPRHQDAPEPQDAATPEAAGSTEGQEASAPPIHGMGYMLDAQAFWDAAMAYSIHERMEAVPNSFVFHVAGSFHVEEGLGMPDKLEAYRPDAGQLIVIIKAVDDYATFDADAYEALGDFVILTDKALPRTSQAGGS